MQQIKIQSKFKIELAETLNQHWYKISSGKRMVGYYPSSTTILNAYPQTQQLTKWIADQGWHEAQRIKSEAGIRGTNIHSGIESLIKGATLAKTEFSLEEWHRLSSFVDWHNTVQPEILATEMPVFSRKIGYAGRADVLARIQGKIGIGDWKSSGSIYDHFPLQVASYATAFEEMTKQKIDFTFILQLGAKNKNNYRYVQYPDWRDHMHFFISVFETWKYDNGYLEGKFEPPVLVLPESLKL